MPKISANKIQAKAIRVLTGMLPMLYATGPSNWAKIMVTIVFVVYHIKSQAHWVVTKIGIKFIPPKL
jgi:hypothetical protein